MSRKSLYNNVIKIKRLNLDTIDAVGGVTQVKTTVLTTKGRIRRLNASEQSVGGKDGVVSTDRCYMLKCDIRPSDELIVDNRIYDVNSINILSADDGKIEVDLTYRG